MDIKLSFLGCLACTSVDNGISNLLTKCLVVGVYKLKR